MPAVSIARTVIAVTVAGNRRRQSSATEAIDADADDVPVLDRPSRPGPEAACATMVSRLKPTNRMSRRRGACLTHQAYHRRNRRILSA